MTPLQRHTKSPTHTHTHTHTHTLYRTTPPSILHPSDKTSRKHTNLAFFNPATASRITANKIYQLAQLRSLIVQSSLKYFPVYQSAPASFMHS